MRAIAIWCMGMIFGLVETRHFGWNLTPQSDAEVICDGITVLLFALAILAYREKHRD